LIEEYSKDVPLVVGNRNEILQIAINLISNSLDATKEGDFVKIKTYFNNDEIVLEIEDNGTGIKDEQQKEIFNEFFTTKKTGTGLGLAVCNEIAKKHDAKLEFTSQYGAWTRFFVRFKYNGDRNGS
jgi:signal transduction histidine kinase